MSSSIKKIKNLDELVVICDNLKKEGKTIVTTNGTFDLFHIGHLKSLEDSKEQGDVLIVGLNSDVSVKKYKSADRPIITQQLRMEVIAGLECVDYVFSFDETTPNVFLNKLKPQVHTNFIEYGEDCVDKETVIKNGGKLYMLKKYEGYSSSILIKKICSIYCK